MPTSVSTEFCLLPLLLLCSTGWRYLAGRLHLCLALGAASTVSARAGVRNTWTAACALDNETLTFRLLLLQPCLQGGEGTAGGATASMEATSVPAPQPGTASRRGAFPFPLAPARSGPRAAARAAQAAGLPGAPGVMAAPATSATPPKKIVAPTVSQINAEFVTQVGWSCRGGAFPSSGI